MCGFPKDAFYYYKSWWRAEPILHLFPHWNFEGREGDEISVWVYSNLDEVELLVNSKTVGRKKVPYLGHLEWKVRFEPGVIEARGFKGAEVALIDKRETTGVATSIRLTADRTKIDADGEDVAMITVAALDKEGRAVPTASSLIAFTVTGAGSLIGVGNGDPDCQESDKNPERSLFNGFAQVLLQSIKQPGEIRLKAERKGWLGPELTPSELIVTTMPVQLRKTVA